MQKRQCANNKLLLPKKSPLVRIQLNAVVSASYN